jgi:hypothetical protein
MIAKKPKTNPTIKRAVEQPNNMKLTFVRNNKVSFTPSSTSVLSPGAAPADEVEKQSEVWTKVSTKKQSSPTKPTTAARNSSSPIPKPHKSIKAAGAPVTTSKSGKVQVQDTPQIIPPAESTTWTKVQGKKPKKTSKTEQPVTAPKQSANGFDNLDRVSKLSSASTTAAKKPPQASAVEHTTISTPEGETSESSAPAPAPETQTSGRKKLTRSQRTKQQKQKARDRKAEVDASSKSSINDIVILVLIFARKCWNSLA